MLESIHSGFVNRGFTLLLGSKNKQRLINDTEDTSSSSILEKSIENISEAIQKVFFNPVQIVKSTSLTTANESFAPLPDLTFTKIADNPVALSYPRGEEVSAFTGLIHNTTTSIADSLQPAPTVVLGFPGGGGEPANDPIGELAINASLKKEADSKLFSLSFNGFITEEPSSNNSFNHILMGVAMAASAFFIGKFAYKAYQRRREQTSEKLPVQTPRVYQVKKRTKQRKQLLNIHFQPSVYSAPLRTYKNPVNPTVFRGNSTSFM